MPKAERLDQKPLLLQHGNYRDYGDYIGMLGYILGFYWDNGKENGNYYLGFIVLGFRVSGLGFRVWAGLRRQALKPITFQTFIY